VGGVPTCVDGDCTWTTYDNVYGAKISGLEVFVRSEHRLSLWNEPVKVVPRINLILYTKRKIDDDQWRQQLASSTLPYVSSSNITADLDLYLRQLVHLNFNAFYVGSQRVQEWDWSSPHYGQNVRKGGFTVFSIHLSLTPYQEKGKRLEFFFSAENLFDKRYAFVKDYPMPGRWIRAGLKGTF
jgi:vitamin B12 transporter